MNIDPARIANELAFNTAVLYGLDVSGVLDSVGGAVGVDSPLRRAFASALIQSGVNAIGMKVEDTALSKLKQIF